MSSKTSPPSDFNLAALLLTEALVFLIVFGGVPVAWLSKFGAKYGLSDLLYRLSHLLHGA